MEEVLHQNQYYYVQVTAAALQEDGRTYGTGYEIVNKRTHQCEFTHMQLPHAMWTADQMGKALADFDVQNAADLLESSPTIN